MRAAAASNLAARKLLFAVLLGTAAVAIATGILQNRSWAIPEDAKRQKNPLQPSASHLKSARTVYSEKCANCHGESGRGDGHDAALYDPAPSNFTDAQRMRTVTDGEMFYQISEGRKPMPAFKKKLTEQQRWELVLLARSFAATSSKQERTGSTQNISNPSQ